MRHLSLLTSQRCFRFHCTDWNILHSLLSGPSREAACDLLLLGPSFVYYFSFIDVSIYLLLVNVVEVNIVLKQIF